MKLKELIQTIVQEQVGGVINEAGLSRLISTIANKDYCIISAFRSGNSLKQNRANNREILQSINTKKMGGYPLIGHWQEAPEGVDYEDAAPEQLTDVVEESVLFVKPDSMSREEFIDFCVETGRKFLQDAIIIGLQGEGVFLYYKSGGRDKIGDKPSLNKIGQAYSQLRKKPNVPFIFEGTISPVNNIGRMAYKQQNMKWF
jgi:hypothetical protein